MSLCWKGACEVCVPVICGLHVVQATISCCTAIHHVVPFGSTDPEFLSDQQSLSCFTEHLHNSLEGGKAHNNTVKWLHPGGARVTRFRMMANSSSEIALLPLLQVGLQGVDNGAMRFTNVRIPRDNLLDRFATVDRGGKYTSPYSPSRRFAATLGELTGGRVGLTCGSLGVLKVVCCLHPCILAAFIA